MIRRRALLAPLLLLVALPAVTFGQDPPQVRLAASANCPANPGCNLGLKRIYKLDAAGSLVTVPAGEGIGALDDGSAEVGIAFSTNPGISRPDILSLTDDRHMIGTDNIVPVARKASLARLGKGAVRRLDAASRLLTTLKLRALNQQVIDGARPAAVGAGFIKANGLSGSGKIRKRTRLVVGFMDFPEDEILANVYAQALREGGYDARVRPIGGLRPEAIAAIKSHSIDMYPAYARSLADELTGKQLLAADIRPQLVRALAKIGARATRFAPGSDQNVFVVKRDTASALGITKISDLARYWPAAA